jgi:hypothetical protein
MKTILILFLIFSTVSVSFAEVSQPVIKTPAAAAKGLFQAWSKKQRLAAQTYGRAEAVEKLFSVRQQKMTFKGCTKREEGDFECIYENKKIDLSIAMIVKIFRAGYKVTEVSFSSEAV